MKCGDDEREALSFEILKFEAAGVVARVMRFAHERYGRHLASLMLERIHCTTTI